MVRQANPTEKQAQVLRWTARLGAITAEALADLQDAPLASARAQLVAVERQRLMVRQRPLAHHPSLFTLTSSGMRASTELGLDRCRVSVANARHLISCAWVAARLARAYPDRRVAGERELRRDERAAGAVLASAAVGTAPGGGALLHRPDLVLWPGGDEAGRCATAQQDEPAQLPVAIEVELTVKAPRRLAAICRGWARCRQVAGVVYVVSPEVNGPLLRAIEHACAGEQIVVLPLAALV